jgi:putative ABC transport system permease protein
VTRFALRGLLSRKLRTALTAIAIVLGVAMISGTYVLTDSIREAFDRIFTDSRQGANVIITGKSAFDLGDQTGTSAPTFDESLLEKVRKLPGVAAAEGGVNSESTQLIDENGKAIVFGGAPNLGFSIANGESRFNPLTLVEGRWPAAGQVVIDTSTADKKSLKVGDSIAVQADGPIERLVISGLVRFGSVATIGGATLAGFDLETAQQLFRKVGKLDEIAVAAKPGVSDTELERQINQILPPGTQVRTAAAQAREDASSTNEFISFLQGFLLAFGGVALFVGAFVISNSLSITIAQRMREFATLRTLGASRRQVLTSVIIESLVMGIAASLTGLFLGLLLAKGLFKLFDVVGFTLPNQGLVFLPRTVVVALAVGILITLIASLRPAIRATRVPPIAAVREGATLPEGRFARFRTLGSAVLTIAGFAALLWSLFGPDLSTVEVLVWMGLGALFIFFGIALLSSRLVRPLAALTNPIGRWVTFAFTVVAWPFFLLPFWLLRYGAWGPGPSAKRIPAFIGGALLNPLLLVVVLLMWLRSAATSWQPEWPMEFPGVLPDAVATRTGGQNAQRNPQRTASTAAALMIGLALVTLVATLAAGIVTSFTSAVDKIFTGDYAITAQNNFSPFPAGAAEAAAKAPRVLAEGSVRTGETLVFDSVEFSTAVTPGAKQVIALDWKEGSQDVFESLGDDGAFVDEGYAKDHALRLGSPVDVTFANGDKRTFKVEGIFDPPTGGSPFGPVTISASSWDRETPRPQNIYTFLKMQGGETDANRSALERAIKAYPSVKAQTRQEFVDNQISGLKSVLNILYVLLALSVLVSLFGIVNTLVLTVFERTREIGMLRAIGMTRRQVRRMIRHESVITALIGAALGITLGVVLAALMIARVDFIGFSFPTLQVIIFVIAAILVGIVAAVFPARRAAKLDPLQAISYE